MQLRLGGCVQQGVSYRAEEKGNLQNTVITSIKWPVCPATTNAFQKKGLESIVLFYLQTVIQAKQAENRHSNKFAVNTMHVSSQFIHEAPVQILRTTSAQK